MAQFRAAVADDHALDDELQDHLLVGKLCCLRPVLDAGAERFQAGADPGQSGDDGQAHFRMHYGPGDAVFTFGVGGCKRTLLWPPGAFDDPFLLPRVPAPAMRETALPLQAGPGHVLFWPADWHRTHDSDGSALHFSLSIR